MDYWILSSPRSQSWSASTDAERIVSNFRMQYTPDMFSTIIQNLLTSEYINMWPPTFTHQWHLLGLFSNVEAEISIKIDTIIPNNPRKVKSISEKHRKGNQTSSSSWMCAAPNSLHICLKDPSIRNEWLNKTPDHLWAEKKHCWIISNAKGNFTKAKHQKRLITP